ncbi:MAG TPA: LEPR-XLL domain-containing protein, partial [Telluria sp.]|nr:LEPR-XLL domain-containing protein [Telluria sp.]
MGESDEGQRQSRFQVEPLEPRILLSGDPVASELARLVDDATHAMFVDDHAAVVEQLKTDIVADAKHADHANQDVAVSGAQAGDERGVAWPSEWSQPNAAENAAVAGKVDLRMAIANLVAAFATKVSVDGAGHGHVIAKVANRGPPTETAPQAITIEFEQDGASSPDVLGSAASSELNLASTAPSAKTLDPGVSTSGSEQIDGSALTDGSAQTDSVQTLLKSVLNQVLAAFAADGNDAIDLAALEGLDIRMASLG